MSKHDPIQGVSSDLTKAVLQKVNPDVVTHFEVVRERVFEPHFGDVGLGLPKPLASGAYLLLSLFEALNDRDVQQEISKTSRMGEAFQVLISEVMERVGKYVQGEEADHVKKGLESTFAEHPSWVDQTFGAFLKPPETGDFDPLTLLERCVLKVIDSQGRVSTGFVLCSKGHMLTPEHVAHRHTTLKVVYRCRTPDGQKQEIEGRAEHVYTDRSRDFAVFHLDEETHKRFRFPLDKEVHNQDIGLTPPPLAVEWQPRDWVLCLGYQEQEIFADPITVEAFIKPHDSIRAIRFRNGHEQECLVFVIPRDHPSVIPGMSGGPVLNLNTGKVIAMVTGATLEAWVKQRWRSKEIWELVSSSIYGFATRLSDVAESWPDFEQCCLTRGTS